MEMFQFFVLQLVNQRKYLLLMILKKTGDLYGASQVYILANIC